MSRQGAPAVSTAQPTCRPRPTSATTGPKSRSLEISHAARLRRTLDKAGTGRRLVICIWGVGYRLCDEPPVEPGA
jgi:hypothetical protein